MSRPIISLTLSSIEDENTPDFDQLAAALQQAGFSSGRSAARCFVRLAADPDRREAFVQFAPHLLAALSGAGSPDRVLSTFERFLHSSDDPLAQARYLATHPRAVEMLVRLFSGSQFLGEILLRGSQHLPQLLDRRRMAAHKTRDRLEQEARRAIDDRAGPTDQLDGLRRFQRWELLRIGACDLLDLFDLPTATMQLSSLADSMIQLALEIAAGQAGCSTSGFAVIGMGKLGGQELNYSSDIDLLFLTDEATPTVIRMAERLVDGLARVTTEGFLYRVDMRLRPWGKVGPLVSSPQSFITYLERNALQWEKQALLKARFIAGDRATGAAFISRTRPFVYNGAVETVRADVFAMKARTEAFVMQKGSGFGDVKLGEGSIRDVEFCVQFLQMAYGASRPEIIGQNTLDALERLLRAGMITAGEQHVLSGGYIFLRTIEHHLQMMDYRQTHTLPDDQEAILSLARRLGFEGAGAGDAFLNRYREHSAAIREIYLRYVGRIEMKPNGQLPKGAQPGSLSSGSEFQVSRHLARMNASYAERFSRDEIARHAALAGQLDDERLVVVDAAPQEDGAYCVTFVAYDYPGVLSLLCGLLFVYGLDILKGDVFTYEPAGAAARPAQTPAQDPRRKIVDVFTVRPVNPCGNEPGLWLRLSKELETFLLMMRAGQRREARSALAKRVGAQLFECNQTNLPAAGEPGFAAETAEPVRALYPIEIEIDNDTSPEYTLLRIQATDTTGFLYELTNALAIEHIYIARVIIDSAGSQVSDVLYVTDESGQKITRPDRQRELRSSIVLVKHFTHLLPVSPNPESALLHFREFLAQLFKRPNWPDELGNLERPEVLQALARLLGVSDFLWDDFLRMQYANLYPVVTSLSGLVAAKSRDEIEQDLISILAEVHTGPQPPSDDAPWRAAVNAFKDREMFRIDMRHILGHTREFWEFASELSDLTEVVVNTVYHLCHEDLRCVYGSPRLENGDVSEMTVFALGKFGGREMGFASDIELMFVYSGNGSTNGPQVISSTEFYEKLVQDFVRSIQARREGIFEIDLQLRPYGKAGSLSVSLDAFRKYFAPEGPAWAYERQALVRLRPVAGNPGLGARVVELRDEFVYTGEPFDTTAMRAMRERQLRHLVTSGTYNLKYSAGGLVDVEYLIQGLQITHGRDLPSLRQSNTREAMAALSEAGILSPDDYARLRKAHTFLRWMIDSLRVVRGNAKDLIVPPDGSEEFAFLARRLRYGGDVQRLHDELLRYTADVQEINRRLAG